MNMIKKKIRTNINFNDKNTIKAWLEKFNYTQNWETFYKHEYVYERIRTNINFNEKKIQ